MKNSSELQTQKLFLHIILLIIWNIVGVFLLINYSPTTALLGIALNLFIIIFSLTSLFPSATWVSLAVSIALFAGAGYSLLNITQEFLISTAVGAGIFILTAVIAELYVQQVHKIDENYNRLQQVTESLVIYDRQTSLMRWQFAKQALTTEVLRGRRYHNDVSLVLLDYRQKDQLSAEELQRINKIVAEIALEGIRTNIDIGFIEDRIGLILPETPLEGALILTKRLIQKFNRQVDARVVAGLANFPDDAITDEDLYEHTQTALLFALNSDQPVVDFTSLQSADKTDEEALSDAQPTPFQSRPNSREDYVAILEDIELDETEWIVWIEGFNQMADLVKIERELGGLDHIQTIEFLFLQANHLVVKISTSLPDILSEADPFPGWEVKKSHRDNRYLLITRQEDTEQHPST